MVEVDGLRFQYQGGEHDVLADLDFEIGRGEAFGFLGPNGSGKTTTQKILTGLLDGFRGRVRVLGRPVGEWDRRLYRRIGVAFEHPTHFLKLTGRENLAYFAKLQEAPARRVDEALASVDLLQDADMRAGRYSKGMLSRLGLARALLHSPDLLFLDEPTAGLDPINARRVKKLIRELQGKGRTLFVTTHDMNLAEEICDRVAFLVEGRIACIGVPHELKLRYGRAEVEVEYSADGGSRRRSFPLDALAEDEDFQRLLRESRLRTMHTQEATLEDVFIEVTGRRLV